MQDYQSAFAYIAALTQADPNTVIVDFRCIHDVDKATAAIPRRGTLPQLWNELVAWNNNGYGVFVNINEMDGSGTFTLSNVSVVRCQVVDLDNLMAPQNYEATTKFNPIPSFAVQSSPGKFHVYWTTTRHIDKDRFTLIQRKLRQLFDGDKSIIDASRVLRLPGMLHLKNPQQPHLVTCWSLQGHGQTIDPTILEIALGNVNVVDGAGGRRELGDAELAAPNLDWCVEALKHIDPNALDRGEWISVTAAFKQAAWSFAPEATLFDIWSQWCARYSQNDPAENAKNWNSIRNSEVGWQSFERRVPVLHAMRLFGQKRLEQQQKKQADGILPVDPNLPPIPPMPLPNTPEIPDGEFLTDTEQREYFKGCTFIERHGEILTPSGRFMNATQFNGAFGGKKFVIDGLGKVTNEAWQAATRSTLWTIPKADHIRFVPQSPAGEMIIDALGRKGINTYRPIIIKQKTGDVTPFLKHMELVLPIESDRKLLFEYMAHNARFPGYKIPWAPLIQSVEGVGKGVLKTVMKHVMGGPYFYTPKAEELVASGSQFNAWMRARLFILVDEIKTDERRDMIEILKPMISEHEIEIQAKGVDQDVEDNYSNWMFLSNYKDAIPVSKNARRFAIFYSAIQSVDDLRRRNMNDQYFNMLFHWLKEGDGAEIVAHWLLNYPIDRGAIPMRAPETSSSREALSQSRGPLEQIIHDAIEDDVPGFKGGWVSLTAVASRIKANGSRSVSMKTLGTILETMGYFYVGRTPRPYFQENATHRSHLYALDRNANVEHFGVWQGYQG
jgi:hypothetical protein